MCSMNGQKIYSRHNFNKSSSTSLLIMCVNLVVSEEKSTERKISLFRFTKYFFDALSSKEVNVVYDNSKQQLINSYWFLSNANRQAVKVSFLFFSSFCHYFITTTRSNDTVFSSSSTTKSEMFPCIYFFSFFK